jgi:hypothetical protein
MVVFGQCHALTDFPWDRDWVPIIEEAMLFQTREKSHFDIYLLLLVFDKQLKWT